MTSTRTLMRSTSSVSLMTFFSRGLGFVRDIILAVLFGATAGFDAFLVAFKVPNLMRALYAEGSFAQAFVPMMTHYRHEHNEQEMMIFLGRILGTLSVILFLVLVVCELLTPLIVLLFAPGFLHDPMRYELAKTMLWITFPYLLFVSLTAFGGSILNSYGRFAFPAFVPIILNIVLILAGVFFAAKFAVHELALAWGIFAAGLVQLCLQIPVLHRMGLLPKPSWAYRDPEVMQALKRIIPALLGVSGMQIGLLINTVFASFLSVGSISWLYYGDRLAFFPLGVFGVALATSVLPHLVLQHSEGQQRHFVGILDWTLRMLLLISLPAATGLYLLAGPITVTLFRHGQFTLHDMLMTQQCIMAFAVGLPGFMAIKVLASVYYARHNTRTPVRLAMVAILLNIVLCLALIGPLAHVGLALATSIAASVNAGLLMYFLWQQKIYQPLSGWAGFLLRLGFANMVMSVFVYLLMPSLDQWLTWSEPYQVSHLLLWLVGATLIYFGSLWLSGVRRRHFKLSLIST